MESHSLSSQTIRAKFPIQSLPRAFNGPKPKSLFSLPSSPTQQSISFHIFPTMPLLTSASRRLQIHRRSFPSSKFRARALGSDSGRQLNVTRELIVLNSALTLILGVANRVLYKLALVPMKEYPFFLAQLTTFGYLAIYLSILYARYRAGIVTKEMVAYPKSRFFLIGFLEALGVLCGMYAGAMLPGPAIPILSQTFLVWQLALSVFILGRSYSLNQIAGCLLVAAGVVLAVTRATLMHHLPESLSNLLAQKGAPQSIIKLQENPRYFTSIYKVVWKHAGLIYFFFSSLSFFLWTTPFGR